MHGLRNAVGGKFFFRDHGQDKQPAEPKRSKAFSQRESYELEPLENRLLLSVVLLGVPDFTDQGPATTINGQVAGLAGPNPVVGAIEAIAAHPTNVNTIFVGSIAGGIWRTTDGGANWTPLTEQLPTLAISALAYSPLDATNNTLFAGTGSFSSGGNGGPAVGALRTVDNGNTWVPIGTEFSGQRVRSIVPTAIGTSLANQVVLAATVDGGGVYRSLNGGGAFSLVSGTSGTTDGLDNDADGSIDEAGELNLPIGNASQLVRDPGNVNRFYAALPGQGVFRSDNGGANWIRVNNELAGLVGAATRIELSVSAAAGNPVYVGLLSGGALTNVFRSANQGGNWTQLGVAPNINPGNQGNTHFSILADNAANNIVYVGGDRQVNSPFVGNLFRGDSTLNTWTSIVLGGAGGTAPHADSRDMVFDAGGAILESDDGGIYRLVNPNAAGTAWQAFPTMPRVTQFITNIAYDELNNTIVGGTQDTGSPEQIGGFNWRDTSQADGGFTAVDNDQVAHAGTTFHYSSSQFFGGFTRRTLDNTNALTGSVAVGLAVAGAGGKTLTATAPAPPNPAGTFVFDPTIQFTQPFVLNAITPARMLIGTSFLYESVNRGDTLTSLGGLNNLNGNAIDDDLDGATDEGDEFTAAGAIGTVTSMVYGGRSGGVDNADLIYVSSGATLRLRTANTTNSLADFTTLTNYTGGAIRDIEIDPDDWHRGYVVDTAGRVFRFVNNGAAAGDWTNITGNLGTLVTDVRDVELFTPTTAAGDDFVLVSGFGGVYRTLNPGATSVWSEFGGNIPNVVCTDLCYDAVDNVLVVGTYGRGAFSLANASTLIPIAGVLQITGDTDFANEDDTIRLVRDGNNPLMLDVFLNGAFFQFQLSTIVQINVDGLGANDLLIVDNSNGLINVGNGIRYNGGTGFNSEEIDGTNAADVITVIRRGTNSLAGADEVRDFSVVVNAAPEWTSFDVGSLTVKSLNGSDQIALQTNLIPAPNKGVLPNYPLWNVNLTIDGGGAVGNIDRFTLLTPGVAATASYTPTTVDGGTLNIPTLTSQVSLTGIEALVLDGQNGQNGTVNLTVVGTGSGDTIVHTPGANNQAGTFQVNSLLALTYQNIGSGGVLTVDGAAGTDTLVVNGTAANDIFSIGAAGQVSLNVRLAINTTRVEVLTLNGLAGDDTFTLVPAISASSYQTINLNGGAQASATGDRVNLVGTTGADDIAISGQTVSLGGKTIVGSGIEGIRVDALAGNDRITYNGVGGVSENITVSSSGVAGGGQISVPGVTLIDFAGVEQIDVNGNTPGPAETDTLTFAGTNFADMFQINLAAAGSSADPILQLQNITGTTLLTLGNYTNFNPLKVLGLDGADTFNVYVAPSGPNRNVLVDGGAANMEKGPSVDSLNVLYALQPQIVHTPPPPDPGLVDLDYGTARFLVQYKDIEKVVVKQR